MQVSGVWIFKNHCNKMQTASKSEIQTLARSMSQARCTSMMHMRVHMEARRNTGIDHGFDRSMNVKSVGLV